MWLRQCRVLVTITSRITASTSIYRLQDARTPEIQHSPLFLLGNTLSRRFSDAVTESAENPLSTDPLSAENPGESKDAVCTGGVYGSLQNAPKLMVKEEVLRILRPCGLTPEQVFIAYDSRLRIKTWMLRFNTLDDFYLASARIDALGTLGTRGVKLLKLPPKEPDELSDRVNRVMPFFRDKSVLLMGVPENLRPGSLERFFEGFALAPRGVYHFWVQDAESFDRRRLRRSDSGLAGPGRKERRTLVKFQTQAEAFRALREKHRSVLQESVVRIQLVQ